MDTTPTPEPENQVRLLRPAWCHIVHWVPKPGSRGLCGKVPAIRATGSGWYLVRPGRQMRICEACTEKLPPGAKDITATEWDRVTAAG